MKKPNQFTIKILLGIGCLSAIVSNAQIEEVVVTAQKRQEGQQDVPISIQAFSGDALEKLGMTDSSDLGALTPGMQMSQNGIGNAVFIRGLGNQDATGGQEGSVGTYVDGVWYGSVTGSAFSLINIERVEVLKGPQGTLFGRNTTGGVINVVTKEPTAEPSGEARIYYGNYDRVRTSLYGSRGLSDKLAADISLMYSNQDEGYGTNLVTGNDINQREDEFFARTKWLYIGEATDVTFSYTEEAYSDDMGYARTAPKGSQDITGQGAPADLRDGRTNFEPYADFENRAAAIEIIRSFDNFDILSITGYKDDAVDSVVDNDFSAANVLDSAIAFTSEAITQELQISSNDNESGISWIGGIFLMDIDASSDITVSGPAIQYDPMGVPTGVNDQRFVGYISTRSYAAFGEIGIDLTPSQKITLGLRYTHDERQIDGGYQAFTYTGVQPEPNFEGQATPTSATPHQEETYNEPTWRIVYDVELSEETMAYASYNRGFRSGNFNGVSPEQPAFDPEFVDAFELGVKNDLLDRTLRLNASMYFYKVKNLQFQVLEGTTTSTVNAANAEILGVESDLIWAPSLSWLFNLGVSLVDGEYQDFDNAVSFSGPPPRGPQMVDASGNQIGGIADMQVNAGTTYTKETDHGEYSSTLQLSYNSGFPREPDNRLEQDSYTLVSVALGWTSPDEAWSVQLTGKNLLDEDYSVHTASGAFGDLYASAAPRVYGVAIGYKF